MSARAKQCFAPLSRARRFRGLDLEFNGSLRRPPGSDALRIPPGPEGSNGSRGFAGRIGLTQAATLACGVC